MFAVCIRKVRSVFLAAASLDRFISFTIASVFWTYWYVVHTRASVRRAMTTADHACTVADSMPTSTAAKLPRQRGSITGPRPTRASVFRAEPVHDAPNVQARSRGR